MPAIFGQFPANFRFSGALGESTLQYLEMLVHYFLPYLILQREVGDTSVPGNCSTLLPTIPTISELPSVHLICVGDMDMVHHDSLV